MDDLMKLEATKESFVLKDYFEFLVTENPEDPDDIVIEVDVKPKGSEIIAKKKLVDKNFEEQKYFEELIRRALTNYMTSQEDEE